MENKEIEMNSPWVQYANAVRELFKRDPEIKLSYEENDGKDPKVTLVVNNNDLKALCIRKLLPKTKTWGNVTLTIDVNINQRGGENYMPHIIYEALKGNPLFEYLHFWDQKEATNCPFCWVQMSHDIIIYPNDDLSDLYGDTKVLTGDLAKYVLGDQLDYTWFNTINPDRDVPEKNNLPEDYKKKKFTCDPDG